MVDGGLFLTLPTQSVAIRLLVGAVVATALVRVLLRAGLRVPQVRVAAALLPALGVLAVLAASLADPRLPALMGRTGGDVAVVLAIENTYESFAPVALPAFLGVWLTVAATRVSRRVWHVLQARRRAAAAVASGRAPLVVQRCLRRAASRMGVDAPPIGEVDGCPGGATVVGIRHPVIVIDRDLAERLDEQELEGVLAHELAHVRRRDNLVALLWGVVRDVAVLVPGSRWALRQLLSERELAADQLAVEATGRPGALASGLLKVLDGAPATAACSPLLPAGTLVHRVELLVSDQPRATRARSLVEGGSVAFALVTVIVAAIVVPRVVAGTEPEGGVGVLVAAPTADADAAAATATPEALVFATYRGARAVPSSLATPSLVLDDGDEVRAGVLRACLDGRSDCERPAVSNGLALRPRPEVLVDETLAAKWRARPAFDTGDLVRVYLLSSVR